MSAQQEFDAYHKWLGIPPHQQPPTHYRLLGLEPFESDPDVIQAAAERQMAHVQSYKIGPQSELSQRLLNEIARAKVCLLNASSKADYDRELRQRVVDQPPKRLVDPPPTPTPALVAARDAAPLRPLAPVSERGEKTNSSEKNSPVPIQTARPSVSSVHVKLAKDRRSNNQFAILATFAVVAVAALVGLIAVGFRQEGKTGQAGAVPEQKEPRQPPRPKPVANDKLDGRRPGSKKDSDAQRRNSNAKQPDSDVGTEPSAIGGPKDTPNRPPDPGNEPGFVKLFNGRDLTGWTGRPNCFLVRDGSLVHADPRKGNLYTDKEFSNFILRFDYKLTSGADNGIGIRTPLDGDPAFVGMEVQLLDESAKRFKNIAKTQTNGSICGLAFAKQGSQRQLGAWNSEEIVVNGRSIKVTLNGREILDQNLDEIAALNGEAAKKHLGVQRTEGHIALMADTPEVEFRNLRIKILPASAAPANVTPPPPVVENSLQPGEFPEIVLPSERRINQELLSMSNAAIKRAFANLDRQLFVLRDSTAPVGLFAFRKGIFNGPAVLVDENRRPSVALSYSGDRRNQALRTWSSDGMLVLYSEYRNGRKAGITCVCDEGRPVRIEEWGGGQQPTEYLVEYEGAKAKVTVKKDASPDQLLKLEDTGRVCDNMEKLLQSHERQWKATFKKWWRETEQQLKLSPDAANKQIEKDARDGMKSIFGSV